MVAVNQLKYIVIGALDLDTWSNFATACLGMAVSERTSKTLYLRCDRLVSRIQVVRSENQDVHALGWNVSSAADLETFAGQLVTAKIPFEDIKGEEARGRKVMRLLRFRDPDGIVQEVSWGVEVNDVKSFKSDVVVDGFATGENGLGHSVLSISNLQESLQFYRDVLGHKVTAHLFIHGFEAIFLRCNARHHSIALSMSNRTNRLQHLQIEYNNFDDLGRAMDRSADLNVPIVATLGKHVSDYVTSFYVRAPSGLTVEVGYGARLMEQDAPTEFENFSGSIWGHRVGMENA